MAKPTKKASRKLDTQRGKRDRPSGAAAILHTTSRPASTPARSASWYTRESRIISHHVNPVCEAVAVKRRGIRCFGLLFKKLQQRLAKSFAMGPCLSTPKAAEVRLVFLSVQGLKRLVKYTRVSRSTCASRAAGSTCRGEREAKRVVFGDCRFFTSCFLPTPPQLNTRAG